MCTYTGCLKTPDNVHIGISTRQDSKPILTLLVCCCCHGRASKGPAQRRVSVAAGRTCRWSVAAGRDSGERCCAPLCSHALRTLREWRAARIAPSRMGWHGAASKLLREVTEEGCLACHRSGRGSTDMHGAAAVCRSGLGVGGGCMVSTHGVSPLEQDERRVLRVAGEERLLSSAPEVVADRVPAPMQRVPGKLDAQDDERDGAKGRLHPVPCPRADLKPRLEVLGLGHIGCDKAFIEPERDIVVEDHGQRAGADN
mmetsp:Transcript_24406/g.61946  ORF Transcript_24406/g.61946 Transcript_24406/m.61946 type:complete len:256 (+) Transcript_24406:79-846(+)